MTHHKKREDFRARCSIRIQHLTAVLYSPLSRPSQEIAPVELQVGRHSVKLDQLAADLHNEPKIRAELLVNNLQCICKLIITNETAGTNIGI